MIVQHYKLNLIPGNVKPIVAVSQYDTARRIIFHIYDGEEEYEPSGTAKVIIGINQFDAEIDGSQVIFEIDETMTQNEDSKFGEIVFYGDGNVATCNFIFRVYFTPVSEPPSPVPDRMNRALSIILGRTVQTPDAEEAFNILMG